MVTYKSLLSLLFFMLVHPALADGPEPLISEFEPTPKVLAARARLRERRAAEAEARQRAEAARAARVQELLRGASHDADGPDVRHVAAVAPDILALSIQEKEFVPAPQVAYQAQPEDEIRREGKQRVLVVEDGQVQQSPLEVVVFRQSGKKKGRLGHLATNAQRVKPDDTASGQDLTTETVTEPQAYRITIVDDANMTESWTPAAVWWKRKPNAYRSLAHGVEVYLKLPQPLAEGRTYRIAFPGVNVRQAAVEYRHEPRTTRTQAVHVSGIGFRPDDPFKRAYLSTWLGTGGALHYPDSRQFQLLDDTTGQTVFSGPVQSLVSADDKESFRAGRNYSKTDVLGMDFSAWTKPGRYRVCIPAIGCSYPFEIAADVWTRAFQLSMKGLLHHRSGVELGPPFTNYHRPRTMHPADGVHVFASTGAEMEARQVRTASSRCWPRNGPIVCCPTPGAATWTPATGTAIPVIRPRCGCWSICTSSFPDRSER